MIANRTALLTAVALGLACLVSAAARAQGNIAVVNEQAALVNTKEGAAAVKELTTKYTPKQKELEVRQAELQKLNDQLQAEGATMTPEKRAQVQRQLEDGTRTFTRDRDDTRDQYQADQQRLLVPIEQRMQVVVNKYAQQKGYSLVLATSAPVVFASPAIDITKDIVAAFDSAPAVMPSNVPAVTPQKQAPPKPPLQK